LLRDRLVTVLNWFTVIVNQNVINTDASARAAGAMLKKEDKLGK